MDQITTYDRIGGEATVARLCDCFYDLMARMPPFIAARFVRIYAAGNTNQRD